MTNEEQDQKPQRHGYSLVLSSPPCRGQPPCNPIRCYHGRDLLHPRLQDHVTTTRDHNTSSCGHEPPQVYSFSNVEPFIRDAKKAFPI